VSKALLVALAVVLLAVPAAAGYRNPTAGRELVLQIPGMHRAKVRRNLTYERVAGTRLRLDVYHPRGFRRGRLPAVLLGGPPAHSAGRASGQKVGWAQAIAASGMAAVAFDIRSDNSLRTPFDPARDVEAAIRYVRANAHRLAVDPNRLCTLGFSVGTAPWHLWATAREPAPFAKCNVSLYGPLDFRSSAFGLDPSLVEEFSALTYLRRHGAAIPPMLIVKAGREENEGINESIDRFAAAARAAHADVRVVTHATGAHAFDVGARSARSRAVVREVLRFLRTRLAPPLPVRNPCLRPEERSAAVRFHAADNTRLLGVALGGGPAGVALAHESDSDLCSWLPYARELAAGGFRVLAFDLRGYGSSQRVSGERAGRVDRDALAAVDALHRLGAVRVVLAGASLGGIAALVGATAVTPPPAGVVSLSAPASYGGLDAASAVRVLSAPTLFAAAENDGTFAEAARLLHGRSAAAEKELLIVPGSAHGTRMLEDAAVRSRVTSFLRARLG
jgi:dipeptidyl aminopeptidase/acylaminoacyl peptidase